MLIRSLRILSRLPARKQSRSFNLLTVTSLNSNGSEYNTERPVTVDTAIRIDNFPAGVHYCYPTRSINSGRTPLFLVMSGLGQSTRSSVLPRLSREVPAGLNPKCSGVLGHRPLHSGSLCAGWIPAPSARSDPATMLNWTSDRAFG